MNKLRRLIRKTLEENLFSESERREKVNMPIPEEILDIKDVFVNNGYKLYVVGGAVRDFLLGKTPKDYDLATDAVPDEIERIMIGNFRTFPKGKDFGVISVMGPTKPGFPSGEEYEIATFRADISYGSKDLETFLKFLKNKNMQKYKQFIQKINMK